MSIKDSPFQTTDSLKEVLGYCAQDDNFFISLDGLPLLLTEDTKLRQFNSKDKVRAVGLVRWS